MQVVERTHHIDITINSGSHYIIPLLKSKYPNITVIEDDEEYINPFESDWFKNFKDDDSAGGNLKFYRKQARLTQRQLADKLNVSPQFISNMENNSKPISKKMAIVLSELFSVSVSRFIV